MSTLRPVAGTETGTLGGTERARLASDATTPPDIVLELAGDADPAVRVGVVRNPLVPEPVLALLAKDAEVDVRAAVAANPATPASLVDRLAFRARNAPAIQRAVAENPNASARALKRVIGYGRWDVQMRALVHPNCPPALIRRHARGGAWAVRAAIAASTHTPPDLLPQFAHDVRPVRLALATNPNTPPESLMVLLGEGDTYVRGVAASNPAAPPKGLTALAVGLAEPAWALRNIARNPACPPELSEEVLTWLALGGSGAGNPTFDPISCESHPGDRDQSEWYWYREAATADRTPETHPLWRVRHTVASGDRVPYPALAELARDPHPEVRRGAARFETLSLPQLEELTGDEDEVVARLARTTLERKRSALRSRPDHRRVSTVRAALVILAVVAGILGWLVLSDDDETAPAGLRGLEVPAIVNGGPPPPFAGATAVTELPEGWRVTAGPVVTPDGLNDTLGLYFEGGTLRVVVTGLRVTAGDEILPYGVVVSLVPLTTVEVSLPKFTAGTLDLRIQVGGDVQTVAVQLP